ncbi:DUF2198 family protein [Bacillus sp. FJAT-44742]|uniref:DUF2198 family protein n=1 Tax=Bacillus sp. FJAT-44742 TaxID=2014005 RepID=UPI000C240778|nr:DUF2198 family protein [Bacillus sp. FJAT-44742]
MFIELLAALALPFFLLFFMARVTHSFIGTVAVTLMVLLALEPWSRSIWVMLLGLASFLGGTYLVYRKIQSQKTGP